MHCCITVITLFLYIWSSLALGFSNAFHHSISSSFAVCWKVGQCYSHLNYRGWVFRFLFNLFFLLLASGTRCGQVADFSASFCSSEPPPSSSCAIAKHFWDVWGEACCHISWYLTCNFLFCCSLQNLFCFSTITQHSVVRRRVWKISQMQQ